jgi:hypothetical protein
MRATILILILVLILGQPDFTEWIHSYCRLYIDVADAIKNHPFYLYRMRNVLLLHLIERITRCLIIQLFEFDIEEAVWRNWSREPIFLKTRSCAKMNPREMKRVSRY